VTAQQNRKGPKSGTKNPRLIEARRMRSKGATDSELREAGFSSNEIARSFVPNSVSIHQRCRANGCWAILNDDRVCMACELKARIKREGRQQDEPVMPVKLGRPPISKPPLNMDHPAILKPKGS
jgi:hypothetical protein